MFIETPQRFSRLSQLVLALSRFIMTYERLERLDERHRLVKAMIPTTWLKLQLRQMYSYIGGHLFTKLGLPAKYLIGPAGQFQD